MQSNRDKQVEKKTWLSSLLASRGDVYHLFRPGSWDEKNAFQPPTSKLAYKPASTMSESLRCASERIGSLPSGYCAFMNVLGTGDWAHAVMRHPDHLYELDGQLQGFVQLADDVDQGDAGSVMFNLQEGASNQRMYYACVEPFGYACVADSFESWVYELTSSWLEDPEHQ